MGLGYSCCRSGSVGPGLDDRLSGKRVVITGATSGVGRLLARTMAASGAEVVGWGRNETAMEELREEAAKLGWRLTMMKCDVSSKEVKISEESLDLSDANCLIHFEGPCNSHRVCQLLQAVQVPMTSLN